MMPTRISLKPLVAGGGKRPSCERQNIIGIDFKSIRSIDHVCTGCSEVATCCCAKYEVCVNDAELNRIIQVLPEAAQFCPHLKTDGGYDNVFEETESGLYVIDTMENDLCVFAFVTDRMIRCSLHAVEASLGLPLGSVKPKMCVLWPLTFSEGGDVLTLHDDALSFGCNSRRKNPSHRISPALLRTIGHICGGPSTRPD
jgi:hypothetical protein